MGNINVTSSEKCSNYNYENNYITFEFNNNTYKTSKKIELNDPTIELDILNEGTRCRNYVHKNCNTCSSEIFLIIGNDKILCNKIYPLLGKFKYTETFDNLEDANNYIRELRKKIDDMNNDLKLFSCEINEDLIVQGFKG